MLQSDVDAAGLKLMNFARTLRHLVKVPMRQADAVTKFEKEAGAPALRNAGLMLVQRRRAGMLKGAFAGSLQKDVKLKAAIQNPAANPAPEMWAEDLVRGWRVDVWDDKSTRWHSLCERLSAHDVAGIAVDDDREGMLRLAATKAADGNNDKVLYLHEALLTWTGWSLAAPLPGETVGIDDTVAGADAEVPPGIPISSRFVVKPGTLPRLRYGRSYRIRARAVDLAANSLPPNDKDFGPAQPATAPVKYLRFDPLLPPSLALVREAGEVEKPFEGESMERLAIRTFNATPADNVIPSTQVARRFAVAGAHDRARRRAARHARRRRTGQRIGVDLESAGDQGRRARRGVAGDARPTCRQRRPSRRSTPCSTRRPPTSRTCRTRCASRWRRACSTTRRSRATRDQHSGLRRRHAVAERRAVRRSASSRTPGASPRFDEVDSRARDSAAEGRARHAAPVLPAR